MEIATRNLKDHLSEYLKRAQAGEALTITAHGKPIARLVPPEPSSSKGKPSSSLAHLAWIRPGNGNTFVFKPLAQRIKLRKKIQLSDLVLQNRE